MIVNLRADEYAKAHMIGQIMALVVTQNGAKFRAYLLRSDIALVRRVLAKIFVAL